MIEPLIVDPFLRCERKEKTFAGLLVWTVCFHQGLIVLGVFLSALALSFLLTGLSVAVDLTGCHVWSTHLYLPHPFSQWHLTTHLTILMRHCLGVFFGILVSSLLLLSPSLLLHCLHPSLFDFRLLTLLCYSSHSTISHPFWCCSTFSSLVAPIPRMFLFIPPLIFPAALRHAATAICSWHPRFHTSLALLSLLCLHSFTHLLPFSITHAPISHCSCWLSHHSPLFLCTCIHSCAVVRIPSLDMLFPQKSILARCYVTVTQSFQT